MSFKKCTIGIIGCGNIADRHATAIGELEHVQLVAVSSRNHEKAHKMAAKFSCDAYTDFNEMLARPDLDIVILCTPNNTHAVIGTQVAKAGKHLIVEKPLDISMDAADELIACCESNNVKLTCIFQHRFNPFVVHLKQALEQKQFGHVNFGGCYEKGFRSDAYFESSPGRGTWENDGGGVVIMNAIHNIDLLQYLMGPVDEVFAFAATQAHDSIEVEDVATAVVKFKSGALGTIEASSAAFPKLHSRLEINGDQGSAVVENNKIKHWRINDPAMSFHPLYGDLQNAEAFTDNGAEFEQPAAASLFAAQIQDFVDAIAEDRSPRVEAESARHSLAIVFAIYESARTGKRVKVE